MPIAIFRVIHIKDGGFRAFFENKNVINALSILGCIKMILICMAFTFTHLSLFNIFSILGYFPIFGSSGSPFAPVPSKEGSYSSTKVPTPPSLPPVHHHHLDSSSNVVSSTMEDDDKSNIKVTSFRIL